MQRWVTSAIGLLIIYGNLAVILNPTKFGLPPTPALPRPALLHDAFLMTGMFTSDSSQNIEVFLEGERRASDGSAHWIPLSVGDHFPQRRPVTYAQLVAARHYDLGGVEAQRAAWIELARRIRERHNRLHPRYAIARVRFGVLSWPRDPRGYDAGRRPGQTVRELWFTESRDTSSAEVRQEARR